MKPTLFILPVLLSATSLFAEDPGIKQKVENAATTTGQTVKSAAEKAGEFLGTMAEKTREGLKTTAEKTSEAAKRAAESLDQQGGKVASVTRTLTERVESEIQHPLSEDQKSKLTGAESAAREKLEAARKELASTVREISGVTAEKARELVDRTGL